MRYNCQNSLAQFHNVLAYPQSHPHVPLEPNLLQFSHSLTDNQSPALLINVRLVAGYKPLFYQSDKQLMPVHHQTVQ